MNIESTINIKKHYVFRLDGICRTYKLSRNQLLTMLISKFFQKHTTSSSMFKRVRYQRRGAKSSWKTLHIAFSADLFEKCHDMRKFCKISVSFFIAIAIDQYLDTIEKELSRKQTISVITDNYQHCYVFHGHNGHKKDHFHVYWDIISWKELEKKMEKL